MEMIILVAIVLIGAVLALFKKDLKDLFVLITTAIVSIGAVSFFNKNNKETKAEENLCKIDYTDSQDYIKYLEKENKLIVAKNVDHYCNYYHKNMTLLLIKADKADKSAMTCDTAVKEFESYLKDFNNKKGTVLYVSSKEEIPEELLNEEIKSVEIEQIAGITPNPEHFKVRHSFSIENGVKVVLDMDKKINKTPKTLSEL